MVVNSPGSLDRFQSLTYFLGLVAELFFSTALVLCAIAAIQCDVILVHYLRVELLTDGMFFGGWELGTTFRQFSRALFLNFL